MSTTTYDPQAAIRAAGTSAEMHLGRIQHSLSEEHAEAVLMAAEYAHHLAEGGDPWLYPQPDERHGGRNHGIARAAREAVFDAWDEGRERKSLTYPWGGLGTASYRWRVHEHLLDHLGEHVAYSDLAVVGGGRRATPKDVAQAVWSLQVMSRGQVRVRKTKVGGKAGYLARVPVPGDDELTDNEFLKGYGDDREPGSYQQHPPWDFPTEEV